MSRQLALDTVQLQPVGRLAHTEYSLRFHKGYMKAVTGRDPAHPAAERALYDAWGIDFVFSTGNGLYADWPNRGRTTDMGHAIYAADGSDRREAKLCPFNTVEDVWAFDAVSEYGLPSAQEQVTAYRREHEDSLAAYPGQLVTGGYYRTIVSGAIAAFGWDLFLLALSDPAKMEPVLDSFFRRTLFHMEAWAQTDKEVLIQHDDFVWSEGAFMAPDLYRTMIIPRYAELWKPLHAAGKKVLFCSDGKFMEFAEDVAAAGADGFIFEPVNDFEWMVERFGSSHCLVGSAVNCVDLTLGKWEKAKRDMDRTFELSRSCKGLIFAVGNHLPANIPDDMMQRFIDYFLLHRGREDARTHRDALEPPMKDEEASAQ